MTNSVSAGFAKALKKVFPNYLTLENKNKYVIFHHDDYIKWP